MIDPEAITAAWHSGFVSGVMVTCGVFWLGWAWKKWCER